MWLDAGEELKAHVLRAVGRLKAGGRIVANVRTKAVEYAEAVRVDVVLANAVVTEGGRFVQGLSRESFRIFDDDRSVPLRASSRRKHRSNSCLRSTSAEAWKRRCPR